jgi:hydroxymethylbilane synthase
LALRQVALVGGLLGVDVEPIIVSTAGDRLGDVPLRSIAGQGAFTGDVRTALAGGAADLAVHSAKDVPPLDDERFLIAYPPRADARDVLIGAFLAEIPIGRTVASGAPRRRAQLADLRPDLTLAELRGNIDTRLAKGADFHAIVMAAAALHRLRLTPDRPTQFLPVEEFTPQVGQGALAVEARAGDRAASDLLAALDDVETRIAVTAERAFLEAHGGDCDLPAGAHATVGSSDVVELQAFLSADGQLVRRRETGADPAAVGSAAAEGLLAALAKASRRTVS